MSSPMANTRKYGLRRSMELLEPFANPVFAMFIVLTRRKWSLRQAGVFDSPPLTSYLGLLICKYKNV